MSKKVILITGSSKGIGANLIENFARKDFNVVINYSKSESEANDLLNRVYEISGDDSVLCIKADVRNRDQINKMFDRIYSKFNRCDVLINNAGVNIDKPFLDMKFKEWQTVLDTILNGTFNCSQEFAKRYQGYKGHIVNIGAVTGISGRKNGINYCTARAGILNMTHCMALELAPNITVNTITPGYINTDEVMKRKSLHINSDFRHIQFD